jgi:hypothetical protein
VELLRNPSFEEDGRSFVNPPSGWGYFEFNEPADGTLRSGDHGLGFLPHHGEFVAGKVTDWGNPHHGFYQTIAVTAGQPYSPTAYLYTMVTQGGPAGEGRLGVDPMGGTDPTSPYILWGPWSQSAAGWTRISLGRKGALRAETLAMTLFLELRQTQRVPWNTVFFDSASILGVPASPTNTPTVSQTPTWTPTPFVDVDGDGIPDGLERRVPFQGQTNVYLPDSDGDGLGDGVEDANRNGLHLEEGETDPRERNTDGDSCEDGIEVLLLGSDPLDILSPDLVFPDRDGDALSANIDPDDSAQDTDGDRFLDGYEAVSIGLEGVTSPLHRPRLGDVEQNGYWDSADSQRMLNFFACIETHGTQPALCDIDRNGVIDNADGQQMLNFFAHLTPVLPVR